MGNNLKTVTVMDNTEYLGDMITGSDVIPYRLESDLERIFENLTYKKAKDTIQDIDEKAENLKQKLITLRLPKKSSLKN